MAILRKPQTGSIDAAAMGRFSQSCRQEGHSGEVSNKHRFPYILSLLKSHHPNGLSIRAPMRPGPSPCDCLSSCPRSWTSHCGLFPNREGCTTERTGEHHSRWVLHITQLAVGFHLELGGFPLCRAPFVVGGRSNLDWHD